MVMTSKIGRVTGNAFTASRYGRGDQSAVSCDVVTGCTTSDGMGFTDTDEGGCDCAVTASTI